MYLMTVCRPDLAYAASMLARKEKSIIACLSHRRAIDHAPEQPAESANPDP